MGIPALGIGPVLFAAVDVGDACQEDAGGRDDQIGAFDGDRPLDVAHGAQHGRMQSEGLAHAVGVEGEFLNVLVGERFGDGAENLELFGLQFGGDGGFGGEVQDQPGAGDGGGGLAGHEESNH